jgi:hypothetical protein
MDKKWYDYGFRFFAGGYAKFQDKTSKIYINAVNFNLAGF